MGRTIYYPEKLESADFIKANQHYGGLDSLRSLYNTNKLRYFTNYGNWKSFLAEMDFVFGARMHGLTPAVHAGIPAHFIAHDSRVREMCEFFRLPFSAELDFATIGFNVEKIYNRTDYSEAIKAYPTLYRKFIQFLTTNKITANCDDNLEISEQLDYRPSPGVEVERNPATHEATSRSHINAMFEFASKTIEQGKACPL